MEEVNCIKHGCDCYLKTGSTEGRPTYGKSFYICSKGPSVCNFNQKTKISPSYCNIHNEIIELQSLVFHHSGEKRNYYRCKKSYTSKTKQWCGHLILSRHGNVKSKSPTNSYNGQTKNKNPAENSNANNLEVSSKSLNDCSQISENNSTCDSSRMSSDYISNTSNESLPFVNLKAKSSSIIDLTQENSVIYEGEVSMIYVDEVVLASDDSFSEISSKSSGNNFSSDVVLESSFEEISPIKKLIEPTSNFNNDSFRIHRGAEVSSSDDENDAGTDHSNLPDNRDSSHQSLTTSKSMDEELCNMSIMSIDEVQSPRKPTQDKKKFPVDDSSPKAAKRPPGDDLLMKLHGFDVSDHTVDNFSKAKSVLQNLQSNFGKKILLLKTVSVSALADRGSKLKSQIADLDLQIKQLSVWIQKNKHLEAKLDELGASNSDNLPDLNVMKPPQIYGKNDECSLVANERRTQFLDSTAPLKQQQHLFQAMYAANSQPQTLYGGRMTNARLIEVRSVTRDAIDKIHKSLGTCPAETDEEADPKGLKVELLLHQKQALKWLRWREMQHPPGGILADDMGLGKTLTMISLILLQKEKTTTEDADWFASAKFDEDVIKSNATLIICPASLLHQWAQEITDRCRSHLLKVLVYHGSSREKNIQKFANHDVIITTYNIISKEIGDVESRKNKMNGDQPISKPSNKRNSNLMRIAFERIILDEAHHIKNHKTQCAKAICKLRAGKRWAVTGTPIHNDLLDIFSLLRFLRCTPFDELQVWKKWVDNKSAQGTDRLNLLVKNLLLRRTKDQKTAAGAPIVSLPDKNVVTHEMTLTEEEKAIYARLFSTSKTYLVNYLMKQEDRDELLQKNADSWPDRNKGQATSSDYRFNVASGSLGNSAGAPSDKRLGASYILVLLLRLRQCCSHLSLMKKALEEDLFDQEGIETDVVTQLHEMSLIDVRDSELATGKNQSKNVLCEQTSLSTKISALVNELKKIKSENQEKTKCVVVSQWTGMLDVVEIHVNKNGFRCQTIKGSVPAKLRNKMVEDFNKNPSGPEVMLISLKAGGVGLNLTGGNHLFLMDMHWNPALENQACDRVYRVGQKKDVVIHRFICKDTIEEKILELQKKKLTLASNILSGSKAKAQKLSIDDIRMLFGV